jgi:hypothetical protein
VTHQEFIDTFINTGKVTLWGSPELLLARHDVKIVRDEVAASDLRGYFVPRFTDANGNWIRRFEDVRINPNASPVKLRLATINPVSWELEKGSRTLPDPNKLNEIPVATDTVSGKTLILDSNHTLVNLFEQLPEKIRVVCIQGPRLNQIFKDFEIINRQQ